MLNHIHITTPTVEGTDEAVNRSRGIRSTGRSHDQLKAGGVEVEVIVTGSDGHILTVGHQRVATLGHRTCLGQTEVLGPVVVYTNLELTLESHTCSLHKAILVLYEVYVTVPLVEGANEAVDLRRGILDLYVTRLGEREGVVEVACQIHRHVIYTRLGRNIGTTEGHIVGLTTQVVGIGILPGVAPVVIDTYLVGTRAQLNALQLHQARLGVVLKVGLCIPTIGRSRTNQTNRRDGSQGHRTLTQVYINYIRTCLGSDVVANRNADRVGNRTLLNGLTTNPLSLAALRMQVVNLGTPRCTVVRNQTVVLTRVGITLQDGRRSNRVTPVQTTEVTNYVQVLGIRGGVGRDAQHNSLRSERRSTLTLEVSRHDELQLAGLVLRATQGNHRRVQVGVRHTELLLRKTRSQLGAGTIGIRSLHLVEGLHTILEASLGPGEQSYLLGSRLRQHDTLLGTLGGRHDGGHIVTIDKYVLRYVLRLELLYAVVGNYIQIHREVVVRIEVETVDELRTEGSLRGREVETAGRGERKRLTIHLGIKRVENVALHMAGLRPGEGYALRKGILRKQQVGLIVLQHGGNSIRRKEIGRILLASREGHRGCDQSCQISENFHFCSSFLRCSSQSGAESGLSAPHPATETFWLLGYSAGV